MATVMLEIIDGISLILSPDVAVFKIRVLTSYIKFEQEHVDISRPKRHFLSNFVHYLLSVPYQFHEKKQLGYCGWFLLGVGYYVNEHLKE